MGTPPKGDSKMKDGITHILANANVYDEWYDEGANCVLLPIEYLEEVRKTRIELKRIKDEGLDVASISLYACPTWIDVLPPIAEEFAKKILVYDEGDCIDYHYAHEGEELAKDADGIEELIGCVRTEIDRVKVYESMFSISCCIKHTEIEMGVTIWENQVKLDELPTLDEVLKKELEEEV
jgi:hypothetical protein